MLRMHGARLPLYYVPSRHVMFLDKIIVAVLKQFYILKGTDGSL